MLNISGLLKDYDLKVTPQRVAIVEELYTNGHMNIDEIYKNINSMVERVFLSEVKIPNEKSVYELIKTEHAHLVCKDCGFIEDIMLDSSDIVEQVSKLTPFKVDSTNIVLSGVCSKCTNC